MLDLEAIEIVARYRAKQVIALLAASGEKTDDIEEAASASRSSAERLARFTRCSNRWSAADRSFNLWGSLVKEIAASSSSIVRLSVSRILRSLSRQIPLIVAEKPM